MKKINNRGESSKDLSKDSRNHSHHDHHKSHDGIVLAHGNHEMKFACLPVPDRVYFSLTGIGGDACGNMASADYAGVHLDSDGFTMSIHVGSDTCTLYLYDWFAPLSTAGIVYRDS